MLDGLNGNYKLHITMDYSILMNISSALYFVCYIPELYANYKNKNANIYNMPEKVVLLMATGFALAYSILINDNALIINYAPLIGLDLIAFSMRLYYIYRDKSTLITPVLQ